MSLTWDIFLLEEDIEHVVVMGVFQKAYWYKSLWETI